jgi:lysophospholipase L1-like esterase
MKNIFNNDSPIALYFSLIIFLLPHCHLYSQDSTKSDPDPLRFQEEIQAFIEWDKKNSFPQRGVLFAGSSSIRLWATHDDFPNLPIINRGFGGAHISDMLYYFDQTIKKYSPSVIVFYCGDNDIAFGKTPGTVYNDFLTFISRMQDYLPKTKFVYLPIKPSYSRWEFWPDMQKTNDLIRQFIEKNNNLSYIDTATPLLSPAKEPKQFLFRSDSLHLNQKGYQIWQSVLEGPLIKLYK